jgi:hypothetical protein
MPYDIRIIRSRDFMRLDAQGHADFEQCRRLFSDAIWICYRSGIGRVLVDVREATAELTAAQIASLSEVCRTVSVPGGQHRIAILNRPKDEFDRAQLLAEIVQGEGWNVRVFKDFERGFEWLIE